MRAHDERPSDEGHLGEEVFRWVGVLRRDPHGRVELVVCESEEKERGQQASAGAVSRDRMTYAACGCACRGRADAVVDASSRRWCLAPGCARPDEPSPDEAESGVVSSE